MDNWNNPDLDLWNDYKNEIDNIDANKKFIRAFIKLRTIRPFYTAVYECMERIEDNSIPTMGVSVDTLVYNKEFVEKLPFEQFVFINLHEIAHVCLMHPARCGTRNPEVWNWAADLYVNKLLSNEFHIHPGELDRSKLVEMPIGALFCDSVDVNTDTTEHIYDTFMDQLSTQGYTGSKEDVGKQYTISFDATNSKSNGQGNSVQSTGRVGKNSRFEKKVTITGGADDLIDSPEKSSVEQEDIIRRNLYKAKTKYEVATGKKFGAGSLPGGLEFLVNDIIESHVDWKKLLKKYCIQALSKDSSFKSPDKRMYYQRAIYPGQSVELSRDIKGVKICFDSSGSISDKDIARYFGQVKGLMKQFNIDSEVIYWDTEVASIGNAKNIKELLHVKQSGRGGTDPTCLFEYFDSKKCKIKPIVTVIFTDGFIYGIKKNKVWDRKYRDTIWVMTEEHNKAFKPPFGTVTEAKYSN